jgi:hypothetical protein
VGIVSTTKITWAWGTNTVVSFNPATDILDFGWFQADQFTISEVAGQLVIAIPSNHQTYTLQNTSLQDLHLSNITAKDQSAISKWTAALNSASPPITPPPDPPSDTPPPVTPPVTRSSITVSPAAESRGRSSPAAATIRRLGLRPRFTPLE